MQLKGNQRESDVERYLIKRIKEMGGHVRKVRWLSRTGAPDRLVMAPHMMPFLLELKAPGRRPSIVQEREMQLLREHGMPATWADSDEQVDRAIADHLMPEAQR